MRSLECLEVFAAGGGLRCSGRQCVGESGRRSELAAGTPVVAGGFGCRRLRNSGAPVLYMGERPRSKGRQWNEHSVQIHIKQIPV